MKNDRNLRNWVGNITNPHYQAGIDAEQVRISFITPEN